MHIYTCPEWGAVAPTRDIVPCGRPNKILIHHTAGHHRELEPPGDESLEEAFRYARDIQRFHMSPSLTDPSKPWIDSGHNFLVCRNGMILQGRWHTVSMIQHRGMVVSAHCPGQNDQVGIEHEHKGSEPMTEAQRESSAWLIAWVSERGSRHLPLPLAPHSRYFNTTCPANLADDIPWLAKRAAQIMKGPVAE